MEEVSLESRFEMTPREVEHSEVESFKYHCSFEKSTTDHKPNTAKYVSLLDLLSLQFDPIFAF